MSLDVYVSNDCGYCVNLKVILKKLISNGIITYPVTFINIDDGQISVPTIVKNLKKGSPQSMKGFPVRNLLYKFLEISLDEDEIECESVTKPRKVFKVAG